VKFPHGGTPQVLCVLALDGCIAPNGVSSCVLRHKAQQVEHSAEIIFIFLIFRKDKGCFYGNYKRYQ